MSISAASSSVLLSCAHRMGLSNQLGSAASGPSAANTELPAASAAVCRTSRLVTMSLPAKRRNTMRMQDPWIARRLDPAEVAVIEQQDRLPEINRVEQTEELAPEL